MVCCALPAEAIEDIRGIPQYYAHFWSSVSRNHLIRCYARYDTITNTDTNTDTERLNHPSKQNKTPKTKKNKTSKNKTSKTVRSKRVRQLSSKAIKRSILHTCTTTHSPNWFQLSYCDHLHADHIYNMLRLPKGLQQLRRVVKKTIGKEWALFEDKGFDVHFWKSGTHSWKPQLVSDNHYSRVLQLDAKLPLFVVGSSFSHYQHWMEGALETVDDAYRKMWRFAVEWWTIGTSKKRHRKQNASIIQQQQKVFTQPFYLHKQCDSTTSYTMDDVRKHNYVVLDGYVYDIQSIVDQHPGGRQLLENVLGQDISKQYHRIGHSSTARAWVEQYCKGVLLTK
ncbi:MAG TPA: cytochrome b5 domain-containing protein [Flavobacteriales bacterium]|nr:cytochrome b5 domain-containing protein [Flavobacteriales bacterium]